MPINSSMAGKNIVIAIDIALNKTGIAILSEPLTIYHTDVLRLKTSWSYYRKLDEMFDYFTEFFTEVAAQKPSNIELVLEGRLKRGFSGEALASIEGARVTTYRAFNLTLKNYEKYDEKEVAVYSPDVVKSFFTGRGNASKDAMYGAANSLFSSLKKIEFQEDIYDAIYLGVYHLKKDGKSAPIKKKHPRRRTKLS